MDMFKPDTRMSSNSRAYAGTDTDAGLRSYMLQVYNYMVSALVLTGVVAYVAGTSPAFLSLMASETGGTSPLFWVLALAPLGVVFYLSYAVQKMSTSTAKMWFFGFSILMGLSMFYIFAAYTGTSIARVFFITAGTFGMMSMYGYSTKKDLTSWGSFLMMGLIGIIIASIVNIFLGSSLLYMGISIIGVLIFVGLIAYDTQKLKAIYYSYQHDADALAKSSIMGALSLYLDFINLFIMLLRLFGERR